MRVSIFVDHGNLLPAQQAAGVLDLATKALALLEWPRESIRCEAHFRIYGGWYEHDELTRSAQDLSVELQRDFPAILKVPVGEFVVSCNATAELALALSVEPGVHLLHTYRRRSRPGGVRVMTQDEVGCALDDCYLPRLKRTIKSGRCPKDSCDVQHPSLLHRHEQKIVDTMLACDILQISKDVDRVVLISGDDDFLPPIRSLLLQGVETIRLHPRSSKRRTDVQTSRMALVEGQL